MLKDKVQHNGLLIFFLYNKTIINNYISVVYPKRKEERKATEWN